MLFINLSFITYLKGKFKHPNKWERTFLPNTYSNKTPFITSRNIIAGVYVGAFMPELSCINKYIIRISLKHKYDLFYVHRLEFKKR